MHDAQVPGLGSSLEAGSIGEAFGDHLAVTVAIRESLGATSADRIIVNAQFGFAPDTSFAAAANTTVATAQAMYGAGKAKAVRAAFAARGDPLSIETR